MRFEYLIFNVVVITGPLLLSFDKKVYFVDKWFRVFKALTIPLILFIVWDALVTGRHWWFNDNYTMNFRLLGLPIEEWFFFVTVPFSSLFIWEVLKAYFENKSIGGLGNNLNRILMIFIPIGIVLFFFGKEYTGLALFVFGVVGLSDDFLKTKIFKQFRTYQFLGLVLLLILIFNGYLTARPVVLYGESYQVGLRVFTIPIEDFFYGISHLLLCVIFYENLRKQSNG